MRNILIPHGFQEHYTIGFANGLAANGVPLTIITDPYECPALDKSINRVNLKPHNLASRSRGKKLLDYIGYHLKLVLYLISNFGSTVHITGTFRYPAFQGIYEAILVRMLSRRFILTVHNLLPHERHTRKNRILHWLIYRVPQQLIVHTEDMKQGLVQSFGIKDTKIAIMEHGVNSVIEECPLDKAECRRQLDLPNDKLILLMFGSVSAYKGIETMLESFELLNQRYYLLIAGKAASRDYGDLIKEKVEANANAKKIRLISKFIPDADIGAIFKASDVLIMPYKHIDQSGVVFLAMTMGLPVIAFDVGSLSRYIRDEIGIVVRQKDARGLANAIVEFEKTIDSYSPETIKTHAARYEWQEVVKDILSMYVQPELSQAI
jgi:glycosyltransferase involved in cell wall biosynthesis